MFRVLIVAMLFVPVHSEGTDGTTKKEVVNRKVQRVDFDGDTVDGSARTPDGAYVVQKRSIDFVPLYKVRDEFDENIKNSVDFLK